MTFEWYNCFYNNRKKIIEFTFYQIESYKKKLKIHLNLKMRFVIIMCGGRSGSDLLQSLFDSHREVIQFPGILKFTEDFLKIFNLDSPKKIAINFCNLNPHFFNSRLNLQERHNKLGNKKNSFYLIDKSVFIKNFIKFYKRRQTIES